MSDDNIGTYTLMELLNLRAARVRLILEQQALVATYNAEILKRQAEWGTQDIYTIVPNIAKTEFRVDWKLWTVMKKHIPHQHRPTRTIEIVDERHMNYLRTNEPAIYDDVIKAVKIVPGKIMLDITLTRKETANGN